MTAFKIDTKDYVSHRESIKTGDLLIWSNAAEGGKSGIFLNIIRFFTRSEFAHVGIAVRLGHRLCVLEAVIPKIQVAVVSNKESFYHIPMGLEWDDEKQKYLLDRLGKSYSMKEAVKAYFRGNVVEDANWQCAELVNRFYKSVGLDFGEEYTPSELVKSILSKGYTIVLVNTEPGE